MTDPTDNTITTASTYSSYNPDNTTTTTTSNAGDTTYGSYEDDSITDYGLRGTSDIKPYNTTDQIRGYDPSDYSTSTSNVEDGQGGMYYDPVTGAYDEHIDYRTEDSQRHHRERVLPSGTYQLRNVDKFDDGTSHVHREYRNPNSGTSYIRDYER